MPTHTNRILASFTALVFGLMIVQTVHAADNATLDQSVYTTLQECQKQFASCTNSTKSANGILVFPSVTKADFIIGGAGGKGALIENGKITGYYSIGAASAGLQIGVESSSQIYTFTSTEALNKLKSGSDWRVGTGGGVTLVTADMNGKAVSGDVLAFIFDSKGLHAGISLDAYDVWKTGSKRPQA